jgi:hypothetical protein
VPRARTGPRCRGAPAPCSGAHSSGAHKLEVESVRVAQRQVVGEVVRSTQLVVGGEQLVHERGTEERSVAADAEDLRGARAGSDAMQAAKRASTSSVAPRNTSQHGPPFFTATKVAPLCWKLQPAFFKRLLNSVLSGEGPPFGEIASRKPEAAADGTRAEGRRPCRRAEGASARCPSCLRPADGLTQPGVRRRGRRRRAHELHHHVTHLRPCLRPSKREEHIRSKMAESMHFLRSLGAVRRGRRGEAREAQRRRPFQGALV